MKKLFTSPPDIIIMKAPHMDLGVNYEIFKYHAQARILSLQSAVQVLLL